MLTYAESPPDERLRPFVQSFWTWDSALAPGERFVHHVWPDGCVSLVINFAPDRPAHGTIIGPSVEPRRIVMHGRLACRGVRFRPEAGAAVLDMPALDLRDRSLPLVEAIGPDASTLIETVATEPTHRAGLARLRTWLRRRLPASDGVDPLVSRAVDTLSATHGHAGIAAMAADFGVSTRQLQRRFHHAVGLTPKQYARIRRMRSLLACLLDDDRQGSSWAAIAADLGYADQAHCARELSRLTGLTPRALAMRLRHIRHHAVRP